MSDIDIQAIIKILENRINTIDKALDRETTYSKPKLKIAAVYNFLLGTTLTTLLCTHQATAALPITKILIACYILAFILNIVQANYSESTQNLKTPAVMIIAMLAGITTIISSISIIFIPFLFGLSIHSYILTMLYIVASLILIYLTLPKYLKLDPKLQIMFRYKTFDTNKLKKEKTILEKAKTKINLNKTSIKSISQELLTAKTEAVKINNKFNFDQLDQSTKNAIDSALFALKNINPEPYEELKWADDLFAWMQTHKLTVASLVTLILTTGYLISPVSPISNINTTIIQPVAKALGLNGNFAPWLSLMLIITTMIIMVYYLVHKYFLKTTDLNNTKRSRQKTITAAKVKAPKNPLENNPIASIWSGTVAFFTWFYRKGLEAPISMTIYAFLFFGTTIDLYLPFLPWHALNVIMMNGLVNTQHDAFWFCAICTGFFQGKFFLLFYWILEQRFEIFASESSTENKAITGIMIFLICCFSLIEFASPAIISHIGTWILFNLITWNIKPAVLLLDAFINQQESFIMSFVNVAKNIFNKYTPYYIWNLLCDGLIKTIKFPITVIAIPMLHVLIIKFPAEIIKTLLIILKILVIMPIQTLFNNQSLVEKINDIILAIDNQVTILDKNKIIIDRKVDTYTAQITGYLTDNPVKIIGILLSITACLGITNLINIPVAHQAIYCIITILLTSIAIASKLEPIIPIDIKIQYPPMKFNQTRRSQTRLPKKLIDTTNKPIDTTKKGDRPKKCV